MKSLGVFQFLAVFVNVVSVSSDVMLVFQINDSYIEFDTTIGTRFFNCLCMPSTECTLEMILINTTYRVMEISPSTVSGERYYNVTSCYPPTGTSYSSQCSKFKYTGSVNENFSKCNSYQLKNGTCSTSFDLVWQFIPYNVTYADTSLLEERPCSFKNIPLDPSSIVVPTPETTVTLATPPTGLSTSPPATGNTATSQQTSQLAWTSQTAGAGISESPASATTPTSATSGAISPTVTVSLTSGVTTPFTADTSTITPSGVYTTLVSSTPSGVGTTLVLLTPSGVDTTFLLTRTSVVDTLSDMSPLSVGQSVLLTSTPDSSQTQNTASVSLTSSSATSMIGSPGATSQSETTADFRSVYKSSFTADFTSTAGIESAFKTDLIAGTDSLSATLTDTVHMPNSVVSPTGTGVFTSGLAGQTTYVTTFSGDGPSGASTASYSNSNSNSNGDQMLASNSYSNSTDQMSASNSYSNTDQMSASNSYSYSTDQMLASNRYSYNTDQTPASRVYFTVPSETLYTSSASYKTEDLSTSADSLGSTRLSGTLTESTSPGVLQTGTLTESTSPSVLQTGTLTESTSPGVLQSRSVLTSIVDQATNTDQIGSTNTSPSVLSSLTLTSSSVVEGSQTPAAITPAPSTTASSSIFPTLDSAGSIVQTLPNSSPALSQTIDDTPLASEVLTPTAPLNPTATLTLLDTLTYGSGSSPSNVITDQGSISVTTTELKYSDRTPVLDTSGSTGVSSYPTPSTGVSYPTPSTGVSCPTPSTDVSYPTPSTDVSYPTPSTGVSYPTPSTDVSYPTPSTGVSYPTPSTGVSYPTPSTGVSYPTPSTGTTSSNGAQGQTSSDTDATLTTATSASQGFNTQTILSQPSQPSQTSQPSQPSQPTQSIQPTDATLQTSNTATTSASQGFNTQTIPSQPNETTLQPTSAAPTPESTNTQTSTTSLTLVATPTIQPTSSEPAPTTPSHHTSATSSIPNVTVPAGYKSAYSNEKELIIAITVGIVGSVLLLLTLVVGVFCWRRRQERKYGNMEPQSSSDSSLVSGFSPQSALTDDRIIFTGVAPRYPYYADTRQELETTEPPYFSVIDIKDSGHSIMKGTINPLMFVNPGSIDVDTVSSRATYFKPSNKTSSFKSADAVSTSRGQNGAGKKGGQNKSVKFKPDWPESEGDYDEIQFDNPIYEDNYATVGFISQSGEITLQDTLVYSGDTLTHQGDTTNNINESDDIAVYSKVVPRTLRGRPEATSPNGHAPDVVDSSGTIYEESTHF